MSTLRAIIEYFQPTEDHTISKLVLLFRFNSKPWKSTHFFKDQSLRQFFYIEIFCISVT